MKPFSRDHRWSAIGALWLAAYILGCIGAAKQFAATGEARSPWDPFYRALQLFLMDDSMVVSGPIASWQLELARWLAPAVAAYTAARALSALFHDEFELLRLRFLTDHVVVCGLGRKGRQLVRDLHDHGDRVVVIERDEGNDGIAACRDDGIIVLIGDAADEALLRKARLGRAKYLVAMCGDDGTNVEIAVRGRQLLRKPPPTGTGGVDRRARGEALPPTQATAYGGARPIECFVHVGDRRLRALIDQSGVCAHAGDGVDVKLFNVFENGARAMLDAYPPDRYADPGSDAPVHVGVIGFGDMGESIALQAARVGHYAHGQKLRITVIDRDAEQKAAVFRRRHPQVEQVCDVSFVAMDVDGPECLATAIPRNAQGACALSVIYICLDSDARGVTCALTVVGEVAGTRTPIVVRMQHDAGLTSLLGPTAADVARAPNVHAFRMIGATCRREMVLNESQDILARAIHRAYVNKRRAEGRTVRDNPNLVAWEQLPGEIRDSNRQQADHLAVKLRAAGCGLQPMAGAQAMPFEFRPEEIERLARMEHARWTAERLLAGWRYGPEDSERKISPFLTAWDRLPEAVKALDRNTVREIPSFVAQVGLRVTPSR